MFMTNILDIIWKKASNVTVTDTTGKEYIDFTAGIFAANIGHNNEQVTEAIREYAPMIHTYTFRNLIRENYIHELCKFTGFEDAALFSAGTEATEAAWKVARTFTGKMGVWGLQESFHGKTYGAQIMASRENSIHYAQPLESTCMMIMEPYVSPKAMWHSDKTINRIRGHHNDRKLLLCLDEIQAGFGRTGKMFGYQYYDFLTPDLVCIGKGMGNGFPISGLLGPKKMLSESVMGLSSTHGGNPLACAVGLAVIDFMQENDIIKEAERKGKILHTLLASFPIITQGKGMIASLWFETKEQADKVVIESAKKGLLLVHTDGTTVKIGPPLTIPDIQLSQGLAILKEVVKEVMEND